MPIRLEPPDRDPRGVDGRGHNRLAVIAPTPQTQCALRPLTEAAFWLVRRMACDTRRASWGHFSRCDGTGDCVRCQRLRRPAEPWPFRDASVVIRIDDAGEPWIMNRRNRGWDELGEQTTWEWLANLDARFRRAHDKHGRLIVARRGQRS